METIRRCAWAKGSQAMFDYHDREWGRPCHDDQTLFELLLLESFQAGLSWACVLHKRENFRRAMDGFDAQAIARYDANRIDQLMQDAGIIRCRRKLEAAVGNARIFLQMQKEFGSFDAYIWSFTDGKTVHTHNHGAPVSSELSDRISKDLKKRGMKYVGTVIMYSYLQAAGIVDDHEEGCFCAQYE